MALDDLDSRIVERMQARFPIESRPYRLLAEGLDTTEEEVLRRVKRLQEEGVIREVGPIFDLKRLGYESTLCAANTSSEATEAVAAYLNGFDEVTHNYLRDHAYNIWFTLIAPSPERIAAILELVRAQDGVRDAVSLPAERMFKIKVHFATSGEDE